MEIKINGKKYKAKAGEAVLDVCRREGIRIPTLCAHGELDREAVCRLCLVEVAGRLVTSCTTKAQEGMEVLTESENIKKAREVNMELLWSDHAGKCAACKKNRLCELQKLAEEYKIENFHFVPRRGEMTNQEELDLVRDNWSRVVVDEDNPVISRTTEYCVECRRCINICPIDSYSFNYRAGDTVVGTPYEKSLDCLFCGACVKICPTAALTDKSDFKKIQEKLDDLKILAVAIIDGAIFKSLETALGKISEDKLVGLLKEIGFEKVFRLDFGFYEYMGQLNEKIRSQKEKNNIFSSHCPAFNRLVSQKYPEMAKNIAAVKTPDEIEASFIKNEYAKREKINAEQIFAVSISSCTAKKTLTGDNLDAVMTGRELGIFLKEKKQEIAKVKSAQFDRLEGTDEGSDRMIEAGGTLALLTEKQGRKKLNGVAVNGIKKIEKILKLIQKKKASYEFIEATICPGGCVGGGGQAIKIK